MRLLLAILLVALPTTVSAGTFMLPDGSVWESIDPPAKWLTAPYKGHIEVNVRPAAHLEEICTRAAKKIEKHGCAFVRVTDCDIYVSADLPDELRENIVAHETAHCRGWPPSHPMD